MGEAHKIKVLIVEDMDSLRNKYVRILEHADGMEVVGAADNGYEGVMLAALHAPDIVLMDIEMETKDAGIIASRQIHNKLPECKIIILTVHQNELLIYTAFEEGVSNYVLKNVSSKELIACIRNTYENSLTLKGNISDKVLKEFQRMRGREKEFQSVLNVAMLLTATELHIVYLLWLGKRREEICEIRFIEQSSLKTHIHNILKKLQVRNVKDMIELVDRVNLFTFIKDFVEDNNQ